MLIKKNDQYFVICAIEGTELEYIFLARSFKSVKGLDYLALKHFYYFLIAFN